jgi:uncharacterized protein
MTRDDIITLTANRVKSHLSGESLPAGQAGTGHDWWHVYRVWQNAIHIGKQEKVDMFVVELAALLHDIADWKFHRGDEEAGPREARAWMEKLNVQPDVVRRVCEIIKEVSFKGARVQSSPETREGMVVQDADRLDALGAIGIARAFAYGGHKGQEIYNPDIPPTLHKSFEEYKNSNGTTINHFHEKLLLLKNIMNTETAKRIAEERHKYIEGFLERFLCEWKGEG